MSDHPELDELQAGYKTAVEAWIVTIRKEEALASAADHSVTEIDQWEQAHFDEEEMRNAVKAAKNTKMRCAANSSDSSH